MRDRNVRVEQALEHTEKQLQLWIAGYQSLVRDLEDLLRTWGNKGLCCERDDSLALMADIHAVIANGSPEEDHDG